MDELEMLMQQEDALRQTYSDTPERNPPPQPRLSLSQLRPTFTTHHNEPAENIYLDYAGMNPRSAAVIPNRHIRGVDRNDEAYWRRRVAEERKELEEDGQRAWQDLVRMRRLKEKLLLENRELIRDTAKLKGDVSRLTTALATSQAEVKRLKERYEETWRDKVALQEELSGPASLPLELLMNIAGFVAGNNSYGTLLNFSLLSKRLRAETIPTLYETIIWSSKGKSDPSVHSRKLSNYRHTNSTPPDINYRATVKELARWAPVASDNFKGRQYIIGDVTPARCQVWLDALPELVASFPRVKVSLSIGEPITRDEFRQYFLSAAAIYADKWPAIRSARKEDSNPTSFFKFTSALDDPDRQGLDSEDDDDGSEFNFEVTLEGNLKFEPGKDNFKVDIMEYTEATGRHGHTLNEWYDPEKHRREPTSTSIALNATAEDGVE
ncbi:hypothetical protein QFC21_001888 [Naganishia friedmannii]|uniref:Uncharacterized protein n=1 Tax=Naganishia friedmannii TaxID=89922 RepID=A0ACC2W1N2_9TREE|nr:hypothetical protein QFC21_001888 [Naganishia friedmannii]